MSWEGRSLGPTSPAHQVSDTSALPLLCCQRRSERRGLDGTEGKEGALGTEAPASVRRGLVLRARQLTTGQPGSLRKQVHEPLSRMAVPRPRQGTSPQPAVGPTSHLRRFRRAEIEGVAEPNPPRMGAVSHAPLRPIYMTNSQVPCGSKQASTWATRTPCFHRMSSPIRGATCRIRAARVAPHVTASPVSELEVARGRRLFFSFTAVHVAPCSAKRQLRLATLDLSGRSSLRVR